MEFRSNISLRECRLIQSKYCIDFESAGIVLRENSPINWLAKSWLEYFLLSYGRMIGQEIHSWPNKWHKQLHLAISHTT